MGEDFAWQMPPEVAALAPAQAALRAWLTAADAPPALAYRAELLLEEVAMNVILHGDAGAAPIALAARWAQDGCHLTFEDGGAAFDPTTAELRPVAPRLEEAQPGGLGLVLLRRMGRDLRYVRLPEGRNRLSLRLPREQ